MKTVQVVLDEKLLRAANRAAKRRGVNRSVLFRQALEELLRRERIEQLEQAERRGYERHPDLEFRGIERVASWPDD
jgi:metal-responsive CopG/Arc/MetJ family transcriptional regulator